MLRTYPYKPELDNTSGGKHDKVFFIYNNSHINSIS